MLIFQAKPTSLKEGKLPSLSLEKINFPFTVTSNEAVIKHKKTFRITVLIIYMKKLLDSDWLRAVQFKCNTSAKSVTPVQKV